MKQYLRNITAIAFIFVTAQAALGQCPGCVINASCISSPAAPTICPDTLPDGVAMQPYNVDLSFYLPANFDDPGSGYNVDLDQLDILNIVGMPFGLSFETDAAPANIYYPTSNPHATEHGCARICGTPLMAGQYVITVFVLAHVSVNDLGGISTTSSTSFDLPLTILPASSANSGFTISNPFGCEPHATAFSSNYHSNGNPGYSYSWSFGNGNMSNLENPPAQPYVAAGSYPVSLQTTIDTLGYFLESITVNAATGCNDSPWSAPDYYFKLKQGSTTIHSSAYIENQDPPVTFSFTPMQLSNVTYTLEIWEYDDGMLGADDDCGSVSFNGHTAGTFTLQDNSLVVSCTISHPVITLTDYDTIVVFPSPSVSSIAFFANDSVCQGDSVVLSVTATPGCLFQWYKDTSAIYNAIDSFYIAKSSGTYYVEVTNTNGCRSYSNNQNITVIPNPPKPTFWIIGNTLNTNLTGYHLQWMLEGSPISGADGMSYNISSTGNYALTASNDFGCTTWSDIIFVTYDNSYIAENALPSEFEVMPNPNNGRFTIKMQTLPLNECVLSIYDLTGREVFYRPLPAGPEGQTVEVDLTPVEKGFYVIQLSDGKSASRKKILIQ